MRFIIKRYLYFSSNDDFSGTNERKLFSDYESTGFAELFELKNTFVARYIVMPESQVYITSQYIPYYSHGKSKIKFRKMVALKKIKRMTDK